MLKLILHCEECPYSRTGYFPSVIIKGDRHADKTKHTLTARRLDGSLFEVLGAEKCRVVQYPLHKSPLYRQRYHQGNQEKPHTPIARDGHLHSTGKRRINDGYGLQANAGLTHPQPEVTDEIGSLVKRSRNDVTG